MLLTRDFCNLIHVLSWTFGTQALHIVADSHCLRKKISTCFLNFVMTHDWGISDVIANVFIFYSELWIIFAM